MPTSPASSAPALTKCKPATAAAQPIPTLSEILSADPDDFVATYTDLAAINLACAIGLPQAEGLDIPRCLRALDAMAVWTRQKTARSWYLYEQTPGTYKHSKNVFRVMTMLHHLHTQFGVRYHPERRRDDEYIPTDSADHFIHGLLSEQRTGTCASLPVFAIAVGRRLGYPLKLVEVPEHLFFRWEGGDERFNVEYTGEGGSVHSDEHYHHWPVVWDDELRRGNEQYRLYLTSFTPKQEVAKFLGLRCVVLDALGRFQEYVECLDAAERFDPAKKADL